MKGVDKLIPRGPSALDSEGTIGFGAAVSGTVDEEPPASRRIANRSAYMPNTNLRKLRLDCRIMKIC